MKSKLKRADYKESYRIKKKYLYTYQEESELDKEEKK